MCQCERAYVQLRLVSMILEMSLYSLGGLMLDLGLMNVFLD